MNLRTASPILAALGLAIAGPAAAAVVGDAANYNVFVFGTGSLSRRTPIRWVTSP
jgi:hypothetical protein